MALFNNKFLIKKKLLTMVSNMTMKYKSDIQLTLLLLVGILIIPIDSEAQRHTTKAHISYETENGFSDYNYRDIELITGFELNRATRSRDYSTSSDYAVIWFSDNQVAIVELENVRFSSSTNNRINSNSFSATLSIQGRNHTGTDQNGIAWKICFFDPPFSAGCS